MLREHEVSFSGRVRVMADVLYFFLSLLLSVKCHQIVNSSDLQ